MDADFKSYPDQCSLLSSILRMRTGAAKQLVRETMRKGDVIGVRISFAEEDQEDPWMPWMLPPFRRRLERSVPGPLPVRTEIVRANSLYIDKRDLPSASLNRLLRLAALRNHDFYKAPASPLPTVPSHG